jgi:hypothetical protein
LGSGALRVEGGLFRGDCVAASNVRKESPTTAIMESRMRRLAELVRPTTEFVMSESTKRFIERVVAERIAEDLKDSEWRKRILGTIDRSYRTERKRLGMSARKSK